MILLILLQVAFNFICILRMEFRLVIVVLMGLKLVCVHQIFMLMVQLLMQLRKDVGQVKELVKE